MAAYFVEAQVVLPYVSLLPQDVAVNTFHFRAADGTTHAAAHTAISTLLTDFFTTLTGAQSVTIGAYISAYVARSSGACKIKTYDLTDPQPRSPLGTTSWTLPAAGVSTSMPLEISLCSSYRCQYLSGVPQASCRGRFYVGPLTTNTNTTAASLPARPSTAFQTNLSLATQGLNTRSIATATRWIQYSRKLSRGDDVVAGFVDDEWDIQRRRGATSTARAVWP